MSHPSRPVLGAIAVVYQDGNVILVQRGKDPNRGFWGFPGGHVELGETLQDAAIRELCEETGVIAEPIDTLRLLDVIDRGEDHSIRSHYVLGVVLCRYVSGTPTAQDDAADARWVNVESMTKTDLPFLPQVVEVAEEAAVEMGAR